MVVALSNLAESGACPLPEAFDVVLAVRNAGTALRLPEHLTQALHGLMRGFVRRPGALGQLLKAVANSRRLINRELLGDGQMHGQMQKGIACRAVRIETKRHSLIGVGQQVLIFGMLIDPATGKRLQRRQGLSCFLSGPDFAEKPPNLILAGIEHGLVDQGLDAGAGVL